ncbi:hypothetical protein LAZ67_1001330 [Cordylochernes scorpioides]|uniref:Integrase catalytic domain-containing protein n=1 Tax=Cordylochernes scorpioides TaxID=51811 RepID=A0ABY6JVG2_9ARAC|nr:hypothetical protein LAZ67_1001330 [Cordylochernes scorpioides]
MEREEALERLKKKRTILRTSLSKYGKRIEEYDVHKECDHEELLGQLSDVYEELRRVDEVIGKLIDIKDLEKDLKMVEEYWEKAVAWKYLLKKRSLVVAEGMQRETATATKKEYPGEIGRPTLTGMVKLPKLTMERFYGEISQWLNFWNAFDSSINRNEHLTKIDKFNYLKAYLGGTAAQTVEGFCLSEKNYDKAVELLKKRFGKGERLIDVHMNNLLALKPLRVTKDVRAFRELYGRILVQIRSLESLGVVVESYGNLLCPLLLKLLPSDLKLELHREFTGAFSLGDLIEFLERQLIALESTFGTRDEITAGQPSNEHPQSQSSIVKYRRNERNPLPTAAGFLNASEAVNKRKNCAFCERDHESTKCEFAENLTLEDKLGKLKKKGACFRCLKYGHLSKFCKVKTSCTSCGELRHSRIMCPRKNQNATPARGMMRDETLTNLTTPVVLLPTLRVTIRGKCKERMGRILIDTGSQRSYVLQDTAEEMGYECSKKESLRHSLFGGSNTELYEHGVYDIRLSNLDGSYGCNFEALSQDVICDSVPRVHQGKWMQDLSAHDIELTDLHRGPLEILIGADIAGKLLTGEHRRLPSGLVALQTRLGWTLMGKIPATEEETSVNGLCTTSLLTSDLENLWRLEAIGISDARQDDSIQKETEEYFARTISQDCEGRYQVALPWIRERELLTDNRDVAEKRLVNVRKHLVNTGNLAEYEDILEKWLRNKIIERVIDNKREGVHYLSHRPVFKENSPTTKVRPVFDASAKKKGKDNWATFVMNRVMEIRSLSETEDWYHVPGCLNPADLPSRGCLADSLERSKWWEGPSWLRRPRRDWPHREIYPDPDIVNSEKRKIVLTSTCIEREKDQYYYRFSNYYKILRVTAWMNRFLTNARGTIGQRVKGDLTVNEIKRAELMLVRVIQRESFTGPEDKRLKDFKLCCDSLGLLRVKTKISRRQDLESFRMPLLLPSDHDLVYLLIRWKHETWGHVGLQTLMNLLREDYWILKFRRTVRRVIHQCVKCRRFTAKSGSVESVELPENRVRDASIFEVVGIDLTGPLVLRNRRKVWIVIFTCAVYRAVHLELVTSLSTENFLQAFRRFVARRGRPYVVYSDNGTNFRGASRALGNLDNAVVQSESTKQNINWKFIPPSAPWWGGWWERLIGLLKQLLRKILGQARLEFEELYTIICDTESLMNSRPLTYMSGDVEDLSPLTPALFLHDLKEIGVPDLDSIERASLQKRYRFRQRLREDLRKRFRTEYFGFLRQETRRRSKTRPIKVGDLVLIGQDNAKRVNWPLARVVEVYPGRDGPVRVAKLRTSKGVQIRPGRHESLRTNSDSQLTTVACSLDYKATLLQVQNPMDTFKEVACYRSSPLTRKLRCQESLSDGGRPAQQPGDDQTMDKPVGPHHHQQPRPSTEKRTQIPSPMKTGKKLSFALWDKEGTGLLESSTDKVYMLQEDFYGGSPISGLKGTTWYASIFLVVNAALGAGLLNFPHAFDQAGGILVGISVQLILMVFIAASLALLVYWAELHGSSSYQDVVNAVCGRHGMRISMALLALYCYGTTITFLIIIGDQFDRTAEDLEETEAMMKSSRNNGGNSGPDKESEYEKIASQICPDIGPEEKPQLEAQQGSISQDLKKQLEGKLSSSESKEVGLHTSRKVSCQIFFSYFGANFCHLWYLNRTFTIVASTLVVILPFCFTRRIDFLKYFSFSKCHCQEILLTQTTIVLSGDCCKGPLLTFPIDISLVSRDCSTKRSQDITDYPVPKSRQDSGRQGTSKQIDHCLYRKMEQGREENPKEPMESDPDSESGGSTTFPKKENTLGRTEEIAPGQEDVTPPPLVSDVLGRLTTTLHQLSAMTGLSRDVELPRYDGSYEAQSFFTNYDAQADRAQLQYSTRLRKPPNLLQAPLRVTNTRASFGVLSVLYIVALLIYKYAVSTESFVPVKTSPEQWTDVFLVIPTICFGYQCHVSCVPIFSCLEDRRAKSFYRTIGISLGVCFLAYTASAICGYLTFGRGVESDILEMFDDATSAPVLVAIMALIVKTYTTYPILLFCGRSYFLPHPGVLVLPLWKTTIRPRLHHQSNHIHPTTQLARIRQKRNIENQVLSTLRWCKLEYYCENMLLWVFLLPCFQSYVDLGRLALEDLIRELGGPQNSGATCLGRTKVALPWVLSSMVLAVFTPNIGVVIDFLGSLAACFIFIFPGMCIINSTLFPEQAILISVLFLGLGILISVLFYRNGHYQLCSVPRTGHSHI